MKRETSTEGKVMWFGILWKDLQKQRGVDVVFAELLYPSGERFVNLRIIARYFKLFWSVKMAVVCPLSI